MTKVLYQEFYALFVGLFYISFVNVDDNYGVRLLIVVAPIKSNTKVNMPNIEIL